MKVQRLICSFKNVAKTELFSNSKLSLVVIIVVEQMAYPPQIKVKYKTFILAMVVQ